MPALPARARAAMRSLLSRPQPSSARMSTATDTSCSDSSALSGRPGVPLTTPPRISWSYAPLHPGVSTPSATMPSARETPVLWTVHKKRRSGTRSDVPWEPTEIGVPLLQERIAALHRLLGHVGQSGGLAGEEL